MFFARMLGLCVVFSFCLSRALVAAPSSLELDEKNFRDWRVLCQLKDGEKVCQMVQGASTGESEPEVFLLSISAGKQLDSNYAIATVPVGVYLASGIEIHVDKRRPFKVLYEVCDRTGCHAGFKLSGAVLKAFRTGLNAKVRVWVAKTKAVEFPVSLRGFSAAYQHYKTQVSK